MACKTPEEMLALAKEEGYELSEKEMQLISGGNWNGNIKEPGPAKSEICPNCKGKNMWYTGRMNGAFLTEVKCKDCGCWYFRNFR